MKTAINIYDDLLAFVEVFGVMGSGEVAHYWIGQSKDLGFQSLLGLESPVI